jgi:hypothetical protein
LLDNAAFYENCEYLYQLNDDAKIMTKGWTKPFIHQLETNGKHHPLLKNFGMILTDRHLALQASNLCAIPQA